MAFFLYCFPYCYCHFSKSKIAITILLFFASWETNNIFADWTLKITHMYISKKKIWWCIQRQKNKYFKALMLKKINKKRLILKKHLIQKKVYDRVCSLNKHINFFLLYSFSLYIYRQFFFRKHVFKINRKNYSKIKFVKSACV